jgi:hypothetical protein
MACTDIFGLLLYPLLHVRCLVFGWILIRLSFVMNHETYDIQEKLSEKALYLQFLYTKLFVRARTRDRKRPRKVKTSSFLKVETIKVKDFKMHCCI